MTISVLLVVVIVVVDNCGIEALVGALLVQQPLHVNVRVRVGERILVVSVVAVVFVVPVSVMFLFRVSIQRPLHLALQRPVGQVGYLAITVLVLIHVVHLHRLSINSSCRSHLLRLGRQSCDVELFVRHITFVACRCCLLLLLLLSSLDLSLARRCRRWRLLLLLHALETLCVGRSATWSALHIALVDALDTPAAVHLAHLVHVERRAAAAAGGGGGRSELLELLSVGERRVLGLGSQLVRLAHVHHLVEGSELSVTAARTQRRRRRRHQRVVRELTGAHLELAQLTPLGTALTPLQIVDCLGHQTRLRLLFRRFVSSGVDVDGRAVEAIAAQHHRHETRGRWRHQTRDVLRLIFVVFKIACRVSHVGERWFGLVWFGCCCCCF